jgi:Zn finger protein HypA/HybF involved in hydrogenase expression
MEVSPTNGRTRKCLRCGKEIHYEREWFLCPKCRKINIRSYDVEGRYVSHVGEEIRAIRNSAGRS